VAQLPTALPTRVTALTDELFAPGADHGTSLALVVRHRGQVVHERYGHQPDTPFGPGGPVDADTTLISWSMAKSITHAALGAAILARHLDDGDLVAPVPVEAWRGTEKEAIRWIDLLEMRPGLEFVEDYVDDATSHCLEMLYGDGKEDMASYAASLPLLHAPGTLWNYASGTTNILSRAIGDAVHGGLRGEPAATAMHAFLDEHVFGPCAMSTAIAKFDPAGTFVGSSFVYATATDFARFGQLYLDDGVVDGRRVLPAGWAEHASTFVALDTDGFGYGRHWWRWPDLPDTFGANGYEGQYTVVSPERDLVVVHLGKSPAETRQPLLDAIAGIVRAFD